MGGIGGHMAPFIPLLLVSVTCGVVAHLLAKEKGRHVLAWTILGLIPIVNIFCLSYFVGAANRRLEEKIDKLLSTLIQG
jgi:hypothetical protein